MKKYKLGVEIGAGDIYSSELLPRIDEFELVHLVEPNDRLRKTLMQNRDIYRIAISTAAIGFENKIGNLYDFGYCSFLDDANSFLKLSCEDNAVDFWKPLIKKVGVMRMDVIDEGKIDYLILTNQGSELATLTYMKSRPEIIRTKYYCHNAKHWAYYNQISKWMMENGYEGTILDRSQHGTYFHIEFVKIK